MKLVLFYVLFVFGIVYAGVLPGGVKAKLITGYDLKDNTDTEETFDAIDIGFELYKTFDLTDFIFVGKIICKHRYEDTGDPELFQEKTLRVELSFEF